MRSRCGLILVAALALTASACGGSGDEDAEVVDSQVAPVAVDSTAVDGAESSETGGADDVVAPPAPGQATVSIDGRQFTLDQPGAIECSLDPEEFRFSFRFGDNEVTLGAGANRYDTGWLGSIDLVVANPDGEEGPIRYNPDLAADGETGLAFDGMSMSYTGPMQKTPRNDGTNPPPISVGEGTISVTCP